MISLSHDAQKHVYKLQNSFSRCNSNKSWSFPSKQRILSLRAMPTVTLLGVVRLRVVRELGSMRFPLFDIYGADGLLNIHSGWSSSDL